MIENALMIRPLPIATDMLTSTNAVESYPLFDNSGPPYTFYANGDIVRGIEGNKLYQSVVGPFKSRLCTMTAANPAVCTCANHGLTDGEPITFHTTTGTLPAAIEVGLPYLVHYIDANTFQLYDDREPDPLSLVDTNGQVSIGYHGFYIGDPNTGWWGDPGSALYGVGGSYSDINAPMWSWATAPRWIELGPNNTWAMFDGYNGTATTRDGDLIVTFEPGTRGDAMGMESLVGASARIVINDGVGDVYDRTYPLIDNSEVVDWWSFFFGERRQKKSLMVTDLPQYVLAPEVTVTIAAASGKSAVGTLHFGRQFALGSVEAGMSLGVRDYTTKEEGVLGDYSVVKRPWSKKASPRALLSNGRVDAVQSVLADYSGTPVFSKFAPTLSAAIIFGFFNEFNIEVAYPTESLVSYEIEGVT